ncbi:uncharacterized protein [Nicotiana sylvestris]|uniref:uncharacterized protein n=1 Tax=Nicotiana sylvestris TaxID=4096 RepID=UPI00388CB2A6
MGDQGSMAYKELSVSPDVRLSEGFKVPKFNLYDGRGDPVAYLRVFCSKMRSVGEKDDLLMAYFGESLTGAALEWHNRQDVGKWPTMGDMDQDFVRYFQYKYGVTPDRSYLSRMEKKSEESFREFGLRWREKVSQVSTPIGEKEVVELFLQAQAPTYFTHLIPTLGKPFNDVLKMGEMVEEGIKSDAADTSQGPSPVCNETHMVGMIYIEKEYENSSEFLGGPRAMKLSALSEVDPKNEQA